MSDRDDLLDEINRAVDRLRELDPSLSHDFQALISRELRVTNEQLGYLHAAMTRTIRLLEQR